MTGKSRQAVVTLASLAALMIVTALPAQAQPHRGTFPDGDSACWMMYAQAEPDAPEAMPRPPMTGPHGARPRHLEQFRMLKLLELLDLNDEQEVQFLVEFKAHRDKQLELQQARDNEVEALAVGLKADTLSDNAIETLVDSITGLRRQYYRATEQFLDKVRDILTPAQLGKLVVFQERFEFELLDQIRSFRERRGMHGGGPRNEAPDEP